MLSGVKFSAVDNWNNCPASLSFPFDLYSYPETAFAVEDRRVCVLCSARGDAATDGEGRLLNMDTDKWVHLNCALWSSEVYETLNGALMNVDVAVKRSQDEDCSLCSKKGTETYKKNSSV